MALLLSKVSTLSCCLAEVILGALPLCSHTRTPRTRLTHRRGRRTHQFAARQKKGF